MKKRLVIYTSLIVTVSLLLMFGLGLLVTRSNNSEITRDNLIDTTKIYASIYDGDNTVIKEIDTNIRVSVIASNGEVIADTGRVDVASLENHINREEIQAALSNSPKTVTRYSDTLGRNMMYYAEKVTVGDDYVFIRTATPTESVSAYVVKTIPLTLLILFCVICLSALFSYFLCDKLVKPYSTVKDSLQAINNGNYKKVMPAEHYPEIGEVVSEINDLAEKISDGINETNEEKNKLDYIVNNITDGIIAADMDGNLQMVNKKAAEIFDVEIDLTGKSLESLTSNAEFVTAMRECVNSNSGSVFEITVEKSVYLVAVKALDGWKDSNKLAVAIISDVTASKNSEKLRSDFFANASHELKTPLTAIKGFNEIVGMKNKDKELTKPVAQIAKEADRMLALIDDMLKLSELETGQKPILEDVSLAAVAKDVVESLTPTMNEKHVTVTLEGDGCVKAAQPHVYELVKNLAENAVKYNVDGGQVNIEILERKFATVLTVTDTGIGIDQKDQSRIFERFYRVEKSRSRATGGTGLGLSIVKHVCLIYNADISLKSKLGVGTTVTVTFKK